MNRGFSALAGTVLMAAAMAAICACSAPEKPALVLISIDTLRSDRLPAYGYDKIATPHIDALRSDAILFERAYSPTPTTFPAHASMLTGLLPPDHGVRGNVGYSLDGVKLPYLPRLLREAGYATGASVASFVMRGEIGFETGFDLYEDKIDYQANRGSAGLQRTGPETLEAVLPWLRSVADRPFFLFLHLYEPHTPYSPPEPYASRYESPYDGEIAAVDQVVGSLAEELRRLGVYESAAIVLTSDHGEGLGDHGESEHGVFLYRESIQVPLLLKLPGGERAGESVATPVQLSDIFPTLLGLAGVGVPAASDALPLTDLDESDGDRRLYSETFFPRFYLGWSELVSVIEGRLHFIESPEPELYDLIADPGETANLIESEPDSARRLRRAATSYEKRLIEPGDTDIETWQRMATLGYVGHGQTRVDAELPAPASQVHLMEAIRQGVKLALADDHVGAIQRLSAVVQENPYALVAWEWLGRSFDRLERPREAREAYRRALEVSGEAPHLQLAFARASSRAGEFDDAIEWANRALRWDEAAARALLSEVALARGQLEDAESEARAALELRADAIAPRLTLAQVRIQQHDFEAALEVVAETRETAGGPVLLLGVLKANALASMGRFGEAEEALRQELIDFPQNLRAYGRLALLLARQGRPEEAVATVRRLVETNPTPAGYLAAARALERLGDPRSAQALLNEARRRFPPTENPG